MAQYHVIQRTDPRQLAVVRLVLAEEGDVEAGIHAREA
jgi:hypothetical protein